MVLAKPETMWVQFSQMFLWAAIVPTTNYLFEICHCMALQAVCFSGSVLICGDGCRLSDCRLFNQDLFVSPLRFLLVII